MNKPREACERCVNECHATTSNAFYIILSKCAGVACTYLELFGLAQEKDGIIGTVACCLRIGARIKPWNQVVPAFLELIEGVEGWGRKELIVIIN